MNLPRRISVWDPERGYLWFGVRTVMGGSMLDAYNQHTYGDVVATRASDMLREAILFECSKRRRSGGRVTS